MGLLALLLGFNFAMAASRFEARRALIQEEVNAIGTAYLRAQLLPSPQRQKFTELLRAYVAARIEFTRAGVDKVLLEAAQADASRIGAQLWTLTSTMAAQDPSGTGTELFIQSLNDVIDLNEKRLKPEKVGHRLTINAAIIIVQPIAMAEACAVSRKPAKPA